MASGDQAQGEAQETYIVIGAGHAAGQAAVTLRSKGFKGRLILIGEESYAPYQRPALSKAFLSGDLALDRLYFKPPDYYAKNDIELLLDTTVTQLDRNRKTVTLDDGRVISYDKALLTTGSRIRAIPLPGVDLPGVLYLRTIDDVEGIRAYCTKGAKIVIVGGGYIGLEVAASTKKLGLDVTVLEAESRVMARAVGREVSDFFESLHAEEGVTIKTGQAVSALEGVGKLERVVCADGSVWQADIAVIGVGIVPNQELAREAGLAVDNGIVVDTSCRTQDPDIFAAGDCTNHPNGVYGRRLRLESVHNALEQAKTAAAAMCGILTEYNQVPWFWSDQYDVKLQIAGLSQGYDQIVLRGDPSARKFAAFYLKEGVLIATDAINAVPEYMVSRKLIAAHARIAPERLADMSIPMKSMAE